MSSDGALRACVEARDAGLVRFIGVTGHGTRVATMHLRTKAGMTWEVSRSKLSRGPYKFTENNTTEGN